MTNPPMTWLYAPADRPERFEKAITSGAEAVIFDLEDGVHPDRKHDARLHLIAAGEMLRASSVQVHVRINGLQTVYADEDLAAITQLPRLDGVRLPKTESPQQIDDIASGLPEQTQLYTLIESARGLRYIYDLADHPRVTGIALGEQDLLADTGATSPVAVDTIRFTAVLAARSAALPAPAMAVFPQIHDDIGLRADCERGRSIGMHGRTAIHPRQLPTIVASFTPTDAETTWASSVLQAWSSANESTGALALPDGQFIDLPIVERARTIKAAADRYPAPGS